MKIDLHTLILDDFNASLWKDEALNRLTFEDYLRAQGLTNSETTEVDEETLRINYNYLIDKEAEELAQEDLANMQLQLINRVGEFNDLLTSTKLIVSVPNSNSLEITVAVLDNLSSSLNNEILLANSLLRKIQYLAGGVILNNKGLEIHALEDETLSN